MKTAIIVAGKSIGELSAERLENYFDMAIKAWGKRKGLDLKRDKSGSAMWSDPKGVRISFEESNADLVTFPWVDGLECLNVVVVGPPLRIIKVRKEVYSMWEAPQFAAPAEMREEIKEFVGPDMDEDDLKLVYWEDSDWAKSDIPKNKVKTITQQQWVNNLIGKLEKILSGPVGEALK